MSSTLTLIPFMLLALVQAPAQSELPKELQSLQGTWIITTFNGVAVPPTDPEVTLVIDGAKYSQTVGGKVTERGELRLDASKTPWVMDLFIAEGDDANKAQFGVVKLDAGVLTFKLNAPAQPTRPKDFVVAEGYVVFTAKRKLGFPNG